MNAIAIDCMPIPSAELIARFDESRPGYTTYPTADRFVEAFSAEQAGQMLDQRREGAAAMTLPLSVDVQIPFFESQCCYCAADKIITRHHERGQIYLAYLSRELELHTAHLGVGQAVSQLHFGGGGTMVMKEDELAELMGMLRRSFKFAPGIECAIEVDPRAVDVSRLTSLAEHGFDALSIGFQDFDPEAQKAMQHVQPAAKVLNLVEAARDLYFKSISVDLIYGLPQQTAALFELTLVQLCQMRPNRIALYAYENLPQRFKPQCRIRADELPGTSARLLMRARALRAFLDAGYVYLGMDCFALPDDLLSVAKRQGRLHRNLEGYTAHADSDRIGLGLSAMGKMGATYSQNARTLEEYCHDIDQGRLPVARGLALSRDDLLRRVVIMALMCQGYVDFESIELAYLIDFKNYFAAELKALAGLQKKGLVELSDAGIQVTALGEFFVCRVATEFDRYRQSDRARARFSRII